MQANSALAATGIINNLGLGAAIADGGTRRASVVGRFRSSNLRNISRTAPYMYNAVFMTLTVVINFHNMRDAGVLPPASAVKTTNIDNAGNIGGLDLTGLEVDALVSFLETFTVAGP